MKNTVKPWLEDGTIDIFIGYKMMEGHPLPHCFTRNNMEEIDELVTGPLRYPLEKIATDIVDRLAEDELVDLTLDEKDLAEQIASLLLSDLLKENLIRQEALDWLVRHQPQLEPGTTTWSIKLEKKREEIAISNAYVLP